MSCAVELPATASYECVVDDRDVAEMDDVLTVRVAASTFDDGDATPGIPTFDASDVDHHLEKARNGQSRVRRFIGKCVIVVAAYNPVPLLRVALVQAHTREVDSEPSINDLIRKRVSAVEIVRRKSDPLWDLEEQAPPREAHDASNVDTSHQDASRRDFIVADLPPNVLRVFRQSVLQALLVYVCCITVVVATSLLCLPWDSVLPRLADSPYLLPVVATSMGFVAFLSMWLLYALRFDFPINLAALAFLTVSETACAVAYGVSANPHSAIQAFSLLCCGILLLRALAGRIHRATHNEQEISSLPQAAIGSAVVLAAVSIPLNGVIGEGTTGISTLTVVVLLIIVSLGLLWVSLVVSVLEQTMAPVDHASALVFFQADLVVLMVIEPGRTVMRSVRQLKRCLQQLVERASAVSPKKPRSLSTARARQTVVVPAFWPGEAEEAAVTSRTTPKGTPLYPTHMLPRRPLPQSGVHDEANAVRAPESDGTRRRSSISDDF